MLFQKKTRRETSNGCEATRWFIGTVVHRFLPGPPQSSEYIRGCVCRVGSIHTLRKSVLHNISLSSRSGTKRNAHTSAFTYLRHDHPAPANRPRFYPTHGSFRQHQSAPALHRLVHCHLHRSGHAADEGGSKTPTCPVRGDVS